MIHEVVIVGAGISGLRTASLLLAKGIKCRLVDARPRIAGRALTEPADQDNPSLGLFDLGPTWYWPQHQPVITRLIEELGLKSFVQHSEGAMLVERFRYERAQRYELAEESPSTALRLEGGIRSLANAIAASLPSGIITLGAKVTAIRMGRPDRVLLSLQSSDGKHETVQASAVILALPPRIVARNISFHPPLPAELVSSLIARPTWLAGQAKAVAVYETPFWRSNGLSGLVSSVVGPMQEIHDASLSTGSGALVGFFGMSAKARHSFGREQVLKLVIAQLSRLFGPDAEHPASLLYKDWSSDADTAVEDDLEPPSQFPVYGRLAVKGAWEKTIFFAGTETASQHAGYLEGALLSATEVVKEVEELFQAGS